MCSDCQCCARSFGTKSDEVITMTIITVIIITQYNISCGGHAVAQLVEALRYKSEGRGFDFR